MSAFQSSTQLREDLKSLIVQGSQGGAVKLGAKKDMKGFSVMGHGTVKA